MNHGNFMTQFENAPLDIQLAFLRLQEEKRAAEGYPITDTSRRQLRATIAEFSKQLGGGLRD